MLSTIPAGSISRIAALNAVWKQRTVCVVSGSGDSGSVDGQCLVVEFCGLGMTVALSVTVGIYFGVDWIVVFSAEMMDDMTESQVPDSPARESHGIVNITS